MSDLIPDEKRFERVREYLAKRREVTPVIDGEQFDTIHDIDLGSAGHVRLLASDLEVLVRSVSPVTREAVKQMLAENGFTPNGGHPHSWRCEHPDRYPGACRCVDEMTDDILALLSVSPPAEVEWEYGLRKPFDAVPRMTGSESLMIRMQKIHGGEIFKRTAPGQWVPVKGTEQ